MNCENFVKFHNNFEAFLWASENKPEWLESIQENPEVFRRNIISGLNKCKLFEISEEVKTLLCVTDPPKGMEIRLPFDKMFLDVSFTKEELSGLGIEMDAKEITGVLFNEGLLVSKDGKTHGKDLNICICSLQKDDSVWFDTFNKNAVLFNLSTKEKVKVKENPTTDKKARDFIHKFVLNFINFTNSQEVITVERPHNPQTNQRRIKHGKMPLPPRFEIYLDGKLKRYVDSLIEGRKFAYGYKFDVRGHFRVLQSDKWKNKKGQRIWVPPFQKGEGIYIDKRYKTI